MFQSLVVVSGNPVLIFSGSLEETIAVSFFLNAVISDLFSFNSFFCLFPVSNVLPNNEILIPECK